MADNRIIPTPTNVPPPSQPFPGSLTPGWNDPPPMSTTPTRSMSSSAGRLDLKKRIAFPLQSTTPTTTTTTTQSSGIQKPMAIIPPISTMPPPLTQGANIRLQPIAIVYPTSSAITENDLPAEAQQFALSSLRARINQVEESISDEIERRLCIIEQMWKSKQFSYHVQNKIYRLANAIFGDSYNEAMQIYTDLAVNHHNECHAFITILRHLVLTIQHSTSNSEVDDGAAGGIETTVTSAINFVGTNVGVVSGVLRQEEKEEDTNTTVTGSGIQHI